MHVKRRALFFVYQRTVFVDAYRVATRLRTLGGYEPVFLVARGTAALVQQEIDRCQRDGIACESEEELLASAIMARAISRTTSDNGMGRSHRTASRAWPVRGVRLIKHLTIRLVLWGFSWGVTVLRMVQVLAPQGVRVFCAEFAARQLASWSQRRNGHLPDWVEQCLGISKELRSHQAAALRYAAILQILQPDILCLSEDIPGSMTAPFIKIARQMQIPAVIIPFTILNSREALEACFACRPGDYDWPYEVGARLLAHMHPRWTATLRPYETAE